jgi:hypothetical protein
MQYSQNLRVIGQSMELAQIDEFEVEKDGQFYLVRARSLTPNSRRIIKDTLAEGFQDDLPPVEKNKPVTSEEEEGCLRYDSRMMSCLNGQGQKKRRRYLPAAAHGTHSLSQDLRSLGEHLDRAGARTFTIVWHPKSVSVRYQTLDDRNEHRIYSVNNLQELGLKNRLRRSTRHS